MRRLHLLLYIAFAVTTVFWVTSCGKSTQTANGGQQNDSGKVPERLSKNDYDFLVGVNQSQVDLKDALQIAFGKDTSFRELTGAPSQKAQDLAKILSAECAVGGWTEPTWNFGNDWSANEQMGDGKSGNCPLGYSREWVFVKGSSSFAQREAFQYRTDDVRKLGTVFERSGSYSAAAKTIHKTFHIGGQGDILFKIGGWGDFRVHLTISHILVNTRAYGTVGAMMTGPNGFRHFARVEQNNGPDERDYFVDSQRMEHKEFLTLFSALRLDEIMDNTRKIR